MQRSIRSDCLSSSTRHSYVEAADLRPRPCPSAKQHLCFSTENRYWRESRAYAKDAISRSTAGDDGCICGVMSDISTLANAVRRDIQGHTKDDSAVEVHGEEHADVAHAERDPVKDGPDGVFLDARTVIESGQDWRQKSGCYVLRRTCDRDLVETSGVPPEARDSARGLAEPRCRKNNGAGRAQSRAATSPAMTTYRKGAGSGISPLSVFCARF